MKPNFFISSNVFDTYSMHGLNETKTPPSFNLFLACCTAPQGIGKSMKTASTIPSKRFSSVIWILKYSE